MRPNLEAMHPELRWRLEEVAKQCRRRRLMASLRRVGWVLFGLTCLFTGLFAVFSPDGKTGTILLAAYSLGVLSSLAVVGYRSLRQPVTIEQVALYIDEHHPELENRLASALDLSLKRKPGQSEWMIDRFVEETVPLIRNTSFADVINPRLASNLTVSAVCMLLSSGIVFYVFSGLWLPALGFVLPEQIAQVIALPFTVEPGDVRVRRGDNQMIWIRTDETDRALRMRWRVANGVWENTPVGRSGTEQVYYHQFSDIQQDIQYQVEYGSRRSETYQITTWIPPEVQTIDLTYHYPEYLERPSREVPNSGNITAIEGTNVDVDVWVNKKIQRVEMVFEDGKRIALEQKAETLWRIPFAVTKNDSYRLELVDLDDAESEFNPEYTITMARDKAPEIKIDFPRGDNEVSILDEVPFDFEVTDDFGFKEFGIQYEVAGKEPVRIALNKGDALVPSAIGHYEIALEEMNLEVGDFITWTVWAKDTKPDRSEYEQMGDPYFMEVRPFRRQYREAVSGAGGAGQGGQQDEIDQMQKDTLIATWNLRRDSRYMDDEEFNEKRDIIIETQESLVTKVSMAAGTSEGPSEDLIKLREAMVASADALGRAGLPDPKAELSEATVRQQMALRLIARMKPRQAEVQQQQGGSGGGGGGAKQRPDISELEMARNRNFYEQENATRAQQEKTDEVLNKIKDLAKRQQSINEELAKLISELQNAKTKEEEERIKRKLARLQEEMQDSLNRLDEARQDLSSEELSNNQTRKASEDLDNARHQMNRSLEQLQQDKLQQARSAGVRAMDALGDIREHLEKFDRNFASQRMRELQKQVDELRDRQHELAEEAKRAVDLHRSPSMEDQEVLKEIQKKMEDEKRRLAQDFVDMMEEASELAERSRHTQELMSSRLGDWMRETAKDGILEDIEESRPLVEYGVWDSALQEERKIAKKFDTAAEKLKTVAEALVDDDLEGMQKALEHLDKLLEREEVAGALGEQADSESGQQEGMAGEESEDGEGRGLGEESGDEEAQRMARETSGEGESPSQGEQGESAQQAQQGQEGEQGQEGQQGQQGQNSQQGQDSQQSASASSRGGGDPNADRAQMMQNFAERGYQDWLQELRDAESLLPEGTEFRTEVTRLRERIEATRREWRARALAPQYDLFLEMIAQPLTDVADRIQREIEKELSEKEFLLTDDGDIPDDYKERVANYFKRLSDAEASR